MLQRCGVLRNEVEAPAFRTMQLGQRRGDGLERHSAREEVGGELREALLPRSGVCETKLLAISLVIRIIPQPVAGDA